MASAARTALLGVALIGALACSSGPDPQLARNKEIVRGYFDEIINGGRFEKWGDYFGESLQFNSRSIGSGELQAMYGRLRAAFPDLTATIEEQVAEGDRVVTRVTFRGTHQGPFMGTAATGRRVAYLAIAIDRLESGKVVEMWHEADMFGVLAQVRAQVQSAEPQKEAPAEPAVP